MGRFVVRRLLQSAGLVFLVMTASFFLVQATPGGPAAALTQNPRITPEQVERLKERFGLNDPLPVRYVKWLQNALVLDFGRSYAYQRPVLEVIGERVWPTVQLGLAGYAIGFLGIPLGVYAASRHGRLPDQVIRFGTVLGTAVPGWWLGLSLIVLMNSWIGWFPNGMGADTLGDRLRHIALPAFLLGMGGIVAFSRYLRSEVLEVLEQDFVRTARAKGLPERMVQWRHILRNALIPVVTILGFLLPGVLSGAIITETIFNWPGMGRLFYEAALGRDYPLLLTMLLIGTVLTILGTLMADIGYGLIDPRVRYS
ncbi:MAG: ABC transporter permease [Chloroflexi bacterium]|nr:ABC transporter permease [Chloroflexota bacterium]